MRKIERLDSGSRWSCRTKQDTVAQPLNLIAQAWHGLFGRKQVCAGLGVRVNAVRLRIKGLGVRINAISVRIEGIAVRVNAIPVRTKGVGVRVNAIPVRIKGIGVRVNAKEESASRFPPFMAVRIRSCR